MKVYIKELGKEEESIQVLNTTNDKFFLPKVGDSVLISYTVIKVEWISFRSGNETVVVWVRKKKENLVKISVIEKLKDGVFKFKDIVLVETSIDRTQLEDALIPRVNERLEVAGKTYEVKTVTKVGALFNFNEIKIVVREISAE